jgi:hypothetical protein
MGEINNKGKNKHSLIRTVYLYLFSLVGLALLIIGAVGILDMSLRAFIFTQADRQERIFNKQLPSPFLEFNKIANVDEKGQLAKKEGEITLTKGEKKIIDSWIEDYKKWQKEREEFDPVAARREREAATDLSLILIGLPLYLYHWRLIKKELTKAKN